MVTRTIKDEALEQVLEGLLTRGAQEHQVCIQCWSVWCDGTCQCSVPLWWPIAHAIRRLEMYLGRGN